MEYLKKESDMKELSVEQKAKAYDEAIERAKEFKNNPFAGHDGTDLISSLFPELKESENEDERIRKILLYHFRNKTKKEWNSIPVKDILTWLKKQGNNPTPVNINKMVTKYSQTKDGDLGVPLNCQIRAYRQGINDAISTLNLKKQGEPVEINPTEFDTRLQALIARFGGLPKEELIGSLSFWTNVVQNDGTYTEEKQGEQEPVVTPKFRIGDIITPKGKKEYYTIIDIVDGWYEFKEKHVNGGIPIYYQFGWELVEQKLTDKDEPKFHEGDWIINNNSGGVYQITEIRGDEYCLWPLDSEIMGYLRIIDVDNDCHLWTIQDAKDGDVLSYRDGQWIFIYKEKIDDSSFYYHALYSTIHQDLTINDSGFTLLVDAIVPATKEQRDLLFQKMKEAGYECDAEKKELKKIEQKLAWSEEDEHWRQKAIDFMKHPDLIKATPTLAKNTIDWLKSLKPHSQMLNKQNFL